MKISEIMSKEVKFINKNKTVQDAAKLMKKNEVGSIPIEDNDKLVGMVTDRDLTLKILAKGISMDTKLEELLDQKVKYCFEDEETKDVADQMSDLKVRRMPVMDRKKNLVGIVSLGDLAQDDACRENAIGALRDICR